MPGEKLTRLDPEQSLTHLLEECRMVLPGIQALFGFQLVAVFNQPFWDRLSFGEQMSHFTALALMALAIGMVLTPASYHRLVEPDSVSRNFLRLASHFMSAGMACLMGGIVIDIFLIARMIFNNMALASIIATIIFLVLTGLWYVLPLLRRRRNTK